ncbi:response regulator (plasmid) [Rhizobium sp. TH2]|uniref:response regulator n=1 Tax=Rhizobium sp. TH2 TaxID=2775403 RepID=UPI002157D90F|nr:response regulator [Rhizobium sp. TH2]UVC12624.1 response regulator [Rhizobium sp. TH2]
MNEAAKPRILVVEDDALLLMETETILREAGFDIFTANDGRSAVAEINNGEMVALVTDINLGTGPNGWDVARLARETRPELPVVYVSGEHSPEWTARGVPNSIMVAKPYAPAQLVTAIATLLNAAGPATS